MAGLAKLRNQQYHKPPLSKPIGSGLFEIRHVGKLNTRLFYFFAKGQKIIAVHGIRNKAKEISKWDLKVSLERKADWLTRAQ
jgi:phage-related protein